MISACQVAINRETLRSVITISTSCAVTLAGISYCRGSRIFCASFSFHLLSLPFSYSLSSKTWLTCCTFVSYLSTLTVTIIPQQVSHFALHGLVLHGCATPLIPRLWLSHRSLYRLALTSVLGTTINCPFYKNGK